MRGLASTIEADYITRAVLMLGTTDSRHLKFYVYISSGMTKFPRCLHRLLHIPALR